MAMDRKTVAVMGIALFAVSFLGQRRSRAKRMRREAEAAAEADRAQRRSHCIADNALPVDVNPAKLPRGWSVAPPIYYASENQAVLPLVTPSENKRMEDEEALRGDAVRVPGSLPVNRGDHASGEVDDATATSAFILCEGPHLSLFSRVVAGKEPVDVVIASFLENNPLLSDVNCGGSFHVEALTNDFLPEKGAGEEVEARTKPAFTHMVNVSRVTAEAPSIGMLIGLHGPYAAVAVFAGFPETSTSLRNVELKNSRKSTATDVEGGEEVSLELSLSDAMRGIARATFAVPYAAQNPLLPYKSGRFAFPGTPSGAHTGQYRVTVMDGERIMVLGGPADLVVRSVASENAPTVSRDVIFEGYSETTGEHVSCVVTHDVKQSITEASTTLSIACPTLAEKATKAQRDLLDKITVLSVQSAENRLATQSLVTVVYTHSHLKAFFSVYEETGVVHEPILTDIPQLFYFPLGRSTEQPCMILQEFPSFPSTWERALKDDDELVHNVRFHFTEWDRERVDCTVTELSGLKCVQFTETKDGVRCRSYVVPRQHTILVIRCEAPAAAFDQHLLLLQGFMDTLHIDA